MEHARSYLAQTKIKPVYFHVPLFSGTINRQHALTLFKTTIKLPTWNGNVWMSTISFKQEQPRKFHPLRPLFQLPGIAKLIFKRQRHYLGLSLLALVDIILAVGLVTNASFFSQAVDRVVLLQELEDFSSVTGRPPFSTSVYIFPSRRKPMTLESAEEMALHIEQTLTGEIGLPARHVGIEVASGSLMLQPAPDSASFSEDKRYLGNVEMTYIRDVASQMEIIEGEVLDEGGLSKDMLDVWMYEITAQEMGINIGEKLSIGTNLTTTQVPIRVAGIWKASDPESDFWFNEPNSSFKNTFLVRQRDYIGYVQPIIDSGSGSVSWYIILDDHQITPKLSQQYLDGFTRSLDLINKYLPGARMNMPPLDPLEKFIGRSSTLTVLLLGYNLPAFAILLYFLALTATIIVKWQRRETVMFVSRGMTITGVLIFTLIEQALLFIVGYPLGILFGMGIARAMGYTESFLAFTSRDPLPVSMEGFSLPLTLLALTIALFSRVWPTLHAARSSLVTEERERARPMNKPFWFRLYLDLILLIPTYYAYDQMSKRGSLAGLIIDKPEDLYRDPLLIVVPALFILTVSLVTMRLFSILMRIVDLFAGRIPWLTLHLALRQLGRQSMDYIQPLLLVIVSLAMGVYTISMAASMDQWTYDRMYYRAGSDISITPAIPGARGDSSETTGSTVLADASWIPLPGDFLKVPGVLGATRVGDFTLRVNPGTDREARARLLALDRAEFAAVAWWRSDFANESLGALMNRLAFTPEAILVPENYLTEKGLSVGDALTVNISIEGLMTVQTEMVIAGAYNYFPTVYDDTVTVIGNLDYLSTLTGLTPMHNIWLKTEPGTDAETMIDNMIPILHVTSYYFTDARQLVVGEQGRMERVGIFGTLTIGFLAAAVMAILGLLIYSYASLQERAYRLAVLNAVGLSRQQLMTQVVMEYAFLALFGAVAGALIGLAASELFVPFFRFTGEQGMPLPPLLPIVASDQLRNLSLIFGITIVGVEVISMASILHNRLVQILKRVWM